MQSTENPITTNHEGQPVPKPVLRWMADSMCLGGLCARTKCRRAMVCRGDPRECLSRYAPLVPEAAREAVKAMLDGLMRGVDFDTMREECEHQIETLGEWIERVQQSHSGWSPHGKAGEA